MARVGGYGKGCTEKEGMKQLFATSVRQAAAGLRGEKNMET